MKAWRRPRERVVEMLRQRLLRAGAPRLQMTGIVLLTAGVGFLASAALLTVGVQRMAIRYPVSVILAYAAFLLFLRGWLALQRVSARRRKDWVDALELPDVAGSGSGGSGGEPFHFGGGSSGGGGAGGTWDAVLPSGSGTSGRSRGDFTSGFSLDLDDLFLLLLILVAAASALTVSVYVIFISPGLFAELLLDGALATGLYRRLKRVGTEHWTVGVVRRTWIPCAIVVAVFSVAGWGLQQILPEAHSIGDIWRHVVDP